MMINLDPDCVLEPSRLDLANVEAWMLWPDDSAIRQLHLMAAYAEQIRQTPEQLIGMSKRLLQESVLVAAHAPRIKEIRSLIGDRLNHGQIAGTIVLAATMYAAYDPRLAALRKIQADICRKLKPDYQIEPRTMQNKAGPIYKFRPVAHLWASYGLIMLAQGDHTFPCRREKLGEFLALAESIRLRAERARAPKSNATVMRLGEAIKLPETVRAVLPKIRLEIAPLRFPAVPH